jgi:hypothetical protein
MFKPNPTAVRTLSRSFARGPHSFGGAVRRRLHAQAHNATSTKTLVAAAAAGVAAGVVMYQSLDFGKVVVHADAASVMFEGPASALSLQHQQVRTTQVSSSWTQC